MILFTSLSKDRIPSLAVLLLLLGALSWTAAAFYTLRVNPDVREFTAGAKIKAEWNQQLRARYPFNYIVFGGSSSSFSVDPEVARNEFDLPLSNLALGAGMGAKVLVRYAASHARAGDTLIMAMEPSLLAGSLAVPQLGQQFSIGASHAEWASEGDRIDVESKPMVTTHVSALRPGGAHFFTLLGKIAMRRPLYRYKIGEFLATGQKTTDVRMLLMTPRGRVTISPEGHAFLSALSAWSRTNGIRVICTLPWAYCPREELPEFRRENLFFLEQMLAHFPVLAEEAVGAYPEADHFADTAYHLNREGARIRTRKLIEALRTPLIQSTNEFTSLLPP